jgi:predicted ester cyclase
MEPPRLIDTFKETFSEARAAFPDLCVTVEDVMAEDDRVAARVVMRGTHRGEFRGIAPTGKRVEIRAIALDAASPPTPRLRRHRWYY